MYFELIPTMFPEPKYFPATSLPFKRTSGETAVTFSICSSLPTSSSSSVPLCFPVFWSNPGFTDIVVKSLMSFIDLLNDSLTAIPKEIIITIEATPITTPNTVRTERVLRRLKLPKAMETISIFFI